jgi:hypothetical protein
MRRPLILAVATAAPAAAFAAAQPAARAQGTGGRWGINGAPGSDAPVRQCVSDVLTLAQFEHRGQNCSRTVLKDGPSETRIDYQCGAAGFGQSQIDVLTPRSLRIRTQGISDQLPFNYVLQARRVGECTKTSSSTRH